MSTQEYAREVAHQWQKGGGVATTAAPQSPQLQHIVRFRLFQRASAQLTAFHSRIAPQLSETDRYYCGRSPAKESQGEGKEVSMEKLSDEDEEPEEGQGESSAEQDKESEMEAERDVHLDEEDREQ